jgi:hypothetical protein
MDDDPAVIFDKWERGSPHERYTGRWSRAVNLHQGTATGPSRCRISRCRGFGLVLNFLPDQPAALLEMVRGVPSRENVMSGGFVESFRGFRRCSPVRTRARRGRLHAVRSALSAGASLLLVWAAAG